MRLALSLVAVLVCASPVAAQATYQMPAPVFGYTEVPPAPVCFVNNANPLATDTSNPCGTVLLPRRTVPTAAIQCGAVVNVDGGGGTGGGVPYNGNVTWTSACGSSTGAFIIGVGYPIFQGNGIGSQMNLRGTYLIVDGINAIATRIDLEGTLIGLRNFAQGFNATTGGVLMSGTLGVVSRCLIQRNGDSESPTENDYHGVTIARGALYNWILGCEIHHNGGDGIQVGDVNVTTPGEAQFTFIGGNSIHDDRENAVDVKFQRDTIISQNTMYGYTSTITSEGAAVVIHESGYRVWVIENSILLSLYGIVSTGAHGFFAIGNLLVGQQSGVPDPNPSGPSGILVRNTDGQYQLYNTVVNWDSAISNTNVVTVGEVIGNIVYLFTYGIRASGTTQTSNLTGIDPRFVDIGLLNFRLRLESPALNAGGSEPAAIAAYNTLYAVPLALDVYGAPRANPYSIGASQLGVNAPGTGPARLRAIL